MERAFITLDPKKMIGLIPIRSKVSKILLYLQDAKP